MDQINIGRLIDTPFVNKDLFYELLKKAKNTNLFSDEDKDYSLDHDTIVDNTSRLLLALVTGHAPSYIDYKDADKAFLFIDSHMKEIENSILVHLYDDLTYKDDSRLDLDNFKSLSFHDKMNFFSSSENSLILKTYQQDRDLLSLIKNHYTHRGFFDN